MKTTIRTRHGYFLINKFDNIISKSLELYGEYAQEQINFFEKKTNQNAVVYDIGSYFGTLSIPFSNFVGKNGQVLAFESDRHSFNMLCGNIELNNLDNCFAFHNHVSNKEGTTEIFDVEQKVNQDFASNKTQKIKTSYNISNLKIDEIQSKKCDLIKINTNGSELDVLKSGIETISNYKPIIYASFVDENDKFEKIKFLSKLNYKCFIHEYNLFNKNNFNEENFNLFLTNSKNKNILAEYNK